MSQAILILYLFFSEIYAEDLSKGAFLYRKCVRCHGKDGLGSKEHKTPKIARQYRWYLLEELDDFKEKGNIRHNMYSLIKDLTTTEREELATYINQL